jgi:hypothetical protein
VSDIHQQIAESLVTRAASAAEVVGASTAISSGAMLGLTHDQWYVVGIVGGLTIGAIGLIARSATDWYFRTQHLKLAQARRAARRSRRRVRHV